MIRRTRLTAYAVGVLGAASLTVACASQNRTVPTLQVQPSAPTLQVQPPKGTDHIGTIAMPVLDSARRRELMIQVWYPTLASRGRPAPYYTRRVAQLVAVTNHVPLALISTIATHAFSAAKPAPGRHPVVLYSPGSGEMRNDATALVEELASRGYITIAIDHPGESQFVQLPDGRVIRGTFVDTGTASNTQAVQVRVADTAAVLRALHGIDRAGLLAGSLDLSHVGMFGFSLGGATTAAALRALPALQAGVDLDGTLYGSAIRTPLHRPFMFIGDASHGTSNDDTWRAGWRELKGFRREMQLRHSGHLSFTDLAGFVDRFGLRSRYPAALQRLLLGSIPPNRAISATRQLLTAFFDRFLRHDLSAQAQLDAPSRRNPDLVRLH